MNQVLIILNQLISTFPLGISLINKIRWCDTMTSSWLRQELWHDELWASDRLRKKSQQQQKPTKPSLCQCQWWWNYPRRVIESRARLMWSFHRGFFVVAVVLLVAFDTLKFEPDRGCNLSVASFFSLFFLS